MKKPEIVVLSILCVTVGSLFLVGMSRKPADESVAGVTYVMSARLPQDLVDLRDTGQRKERFIATLLPLVLMSNQKIAQQRHRLERIRSTPWHLSHKEQRLIDELARAYAVEGAGHEEVLAELLKRVDTLPVSLVLAQAAIESGWGGSRFAREGNNIFGLRNAGGGGMVPRAQDAGKVFRVSVFPDLQSCMDYYFWTINTHGQYEDLRSLRQATPGRRDPCALAAGLNHYSELGEAYVDKVRQVIRYNNLERYDASILSSSR